MSAREGSALAAQVAALKDCAKQAVDNGEYGWVVQLAARLQQLERLQQVEAIGASLRAAEKRVSAHIASMDTARTELRRVVAALADARAQVPHAPPESAEVPAPEPDEAGGRQIPHIPELEEVNVTERKQELWEKFGGLELDPVLGSGAVVLVDAGWMMELADSGGTLGPRQALPPIAFMAHSRIKAATADTGRKTPVLPNAFDAMLQSKSFTNGKVDGPRVAELYRAAFAQRFESADTLVYQSLGWGDEEVEQLATVLTSGVAPRLRVLHMADNLMGVEGAARLAAALGALPELQRLNLARNRLGDEGAARLAAALGALPGLQVLSLASNRVGDEGAASLAAALRAPEALQNLQFLGLSSNRVGDEGAARLEEVLRAPEALPRLQALRLQGNPLGSGARAALRAAWAEAGRPEGGAYEAPCLGSEPLRVPRGLSLS